VIFGSLARPASRFHVRGKALVERVAAFVADHSPDLRNVLRAALIIIRPQRLYLAHERARPGRQWLRLTGTRSSASTDRTRDVNLRAFRGFRSRVLNLPLRASSSGGLLIWPSRSGTPRPAHAVGIGGSRTVGIIPIAPWPDVPAIRKRAAAGHGIFHSGALGVDTLLHSDPSRLLGIGTGQVQEEAARGEQPGTDTHGELHSTRLLPADKRRVLRAGA
jgi:hypothetical protein